MGLQLENWSKYQKWASEKIGSIFDNAFQVENCLVLKMGHNQKMGDFLKMGRLKNGTGFKNELTWKIGHI